MSHLWKPALMSAPLSQFGEKTAIQDLLLQASGCDEVVATRMSLVEDEEALEQKASPVCSQALPGEMPSFPGARTFTGALALLCVDTETCPRSQRRVAQDLSLTGTPVLFAQKPPGLRLPAPPIGRHSFHCTPGPTRALTAIFLPAGACSLPASGCTSPGPSSCRTWPGHHPAFCCDV